VGFIIAFLTIESIGYFRIIICFFIAFFTIGVIGFREFSIVNGVNVYPFKLSAVILSNIVILFLTLVYLGLVFIRVTTFFSFSFLLSFLLLVINYNSLLYKIYKGDFLLVCFIDFILNFWL
jgi:hypothetical protein